MFVPVFVCIISSHGNGSTVEIEDHFYRNQSRSEEITLKEDFGNDFLDLVEFGKNQFVVPFCVSY